MSYEMPPVPDWLGKNSTIRKVHTVPTRSAAISEVTMGWGSQLVEVHPREKRDETTTKN